MGAVALPILWRTGVLDPAAEDVVARVAAEKVAAEKVATGTPGTGTPARTQGQEGASDAVWALAAHLRRHRV